MPGQIEKLLVVTMQNGVECTHKPMVQSEDEWWQFVGDIEHALLSEEPGLLEANHPFGLHRVDDIQAVHFGDAEHGEEPSLGITRPSSN